MIYYELEPKDNTFKTISIQTTYQCQLACSNCYLGEMLNNPDYLDVNTNKLATVLKELPSRADIRFIGAEPTLNKDLPKLIKLTRESGHRPSLLTNGIKLRKESYVKELKSAGLNMLGLSMNGGLDNNLYEIFDGGHYAEHKMAALDNCFKYNILPHINVIVDPQNIQVLKPLLDFIVECGLKYNRKFSPVKFPVALRLKSIGQMGYYLKSKSFTLNELADIASNVLDITVDEITNNNLIDGYVEDNAVLFAFNTKAGTMLGKLTDWNVDDDGVPDSGSNRRGILTDDYKIAPFFEYYKRQEMLCYSSYVSENK